jgi:exodeoxyribonuclease V gamma subunit
MATSLRAGLLVVHANHPESLRDLLRQWLAAHPLDPLEDEWVLVQSNGVAQWLKLSLAAPPSQGGWGIAAALRTELPSRFQWRAYRAVLGEAAVPAESAFDKPRLLWRLMRLLPPLLAEPAFAPLHRFLADDADLRKRHQLAERLADLLDQYQVYRADWLADWAAGRDRIGTARGEHLAVPEALAWQPRLWRALLDDVRRHPGRAAPDESAQDDPSRAEVHRRFLEAAAAWTGAAPPPGLPRRLSVFGISSMPQQSLEVLAAVARWSQVLMCVHNPCEHDWSHVVADQDLLRAQRRRRARRPGSDGDIPEEALHLHAQPLLAAWGKQGRDFIRLLDHHDEREAYESHVAASGQRIDLFDANPGDTLLRQLQDDIRDLRPLAETRVRWPAVDPSRDRSLRFHVTHSPQREVEVLHDQLLDAFARDPSLRPRDVIVMVPDIAVYAPLVQAVFGLTAPEDPRHVPYSLADRGQRHADPLLGALEALLGLPASRLGVSELLDALEVPALRARFGIAATDLPLLQRWIEQARVRWGLHEAQREALGLPGAGGLHTWAFGLRRMLLGYAVGRGEAWNGIEPMDEVGGLDAALLGPLSDLLGALERHWRELSTPATPARWVQRLQSLMADFFLADEGRDGLTLQRLSQLLQEWARQCAQAGLEEPLPLSVVREHWLAALDAASLQQPFFAGAVTFATLMPMRAIPFRVVALLGMNDGDYPRSRVPADFDLMAQDWRPGDRSRREDDRYLFLEALLSARDLLHVSWVGRSARDNEERPPSVLVAQLRDHLAAGWALARSDAAPRPAGPDRALLDALTVTHRLQPFHPAYFDGSDPALSSHAREWRSAGATRIGAAAQGPGDFPATAAAALPPLVRPGPLTLRALSDFLASPARTFLRDRLGVHFDEDDPASEDDEPFSLDGLQRWKLQDELITAQRVAVERGEDREAVLARGLARAAARGDLPVGAFGTLSATQLAEPMARLFEAHAEALGTWPHAEPDAPVRHAVPGLPPALALDDWLGGLRRADDGARARVVLSSSSLLTKDQHYRRDKLLSAWVAHLAGHLGGEPMTTLVIGKNGQARLRPMDPERARHHWGVLVRAFEEGLTRPLPLSAAAGFAWLQRRLKASPRADDGGTADACRPHPDDGLTHAPDGRIDPAWAAAREAWSPRGDFGDARGDRERDPWVQRTWPHFDALWADGEFTRWARALYAPLRECLGDRARGSDTDEEGA